MKTDKLDATGSPIIIGERYGFTKDSSLYTFVFKGTITGITKTGVNMEIDEITTYYGGMPTSVDRKGKKAHVKSIKLFKI